MNEITHIIIGAAIMGVFYFFVLWPLQKDRRKEDQKKWREWTRRRRRRK